MTWVLIIDDVLATSGTAWAVAHLVRDLRGEVAGLGFVVELPVLKNFSSPHAPFFADFPP